VSVCSRLSAEMMVLMAYYCEGLLIEKLRTLIERGKFESFVEANLGMSLSTARKLIRFWKLISRFPCLLHSQFTFSELLLHHNLIVTTAIGDSQFVLALTSASKKTTFGTLKVCGTCMPEVEPNRDIVLSTEDDDDLEEEGDADTKDEKDADETHEKDDVTSEIETLKI
jgi:hypothetical protein